MLQFKTHRPATCVRLADAESRESSLSPLATRSFNDSRFQPLHRRHLHSPSGLGDTRDLSALSVENRHRIPDTTAHYSNIQHPTSKIPNLFPFRRAWKIVSPVLRLGKFLSVLVVVLGALGVAPAIAQSYTDVAATSAWNASRWNNSANGPSYTSTFTSNNNVIFTSGSYSFAGMGAAINVGNITVSSGANVTFTANANTFGTSGNVRTIDVANGSVLDFSSQSFSAATGTGFIKEGQGILKLDGNTYSGGFTLNNGTVIIGGVNAMGGAASNTLTINGGTLAADGTRDLNGKYGGGITVGGNFTIGGVTTGVSSGNGSATANILFSNNVSLGSSTRQITIGANGTYTFNGAISSTSSAGLTVNATSGSTGSLVLGGANTYTGATTINAGTLSISSVANGGSNSNLGASSSAASNLVLGGGTLSYTGTNASTDRNFTLTNGTTSTISVTTSTETLTLSGSAAAGNGSLTKAGAGTLALTGASSHTGNTTVSAGTLALGNLNALQNSTLNTGSSGSQAVTFTVAGTNTYNLGGLAGADALDIVGNSLSVGSNNADSTFSGNLAGTGNLTKQGSGTLILSGTNTYSGKTAINGGTISINADSRLGTAPGSVIADQLSLNGGTLAITTGFTMSTNRGITLGAGGGTLDVITGQTLTYGGVISGSGGLTKVGSGTLTLTGANSYTGATTINAGTISLGANNDIIGNSSDVIISGGNLTITSNTETVRSFTMSSGGLEKNGGGTLTASQASTLSGGTVSLTTGTMTFAADTQFTGTQVNIVSGSSVVLNTGSNATFNGSNVLISGTAGRINTTDTLNLGTTNFAYNNASAATQGIILGGNISVSSGVTSSFTNNTTGLGRISLGAAARVFDVDSSANMNVGWVIDATNSSGMLTKNGTGTLTLSAANTYSGTTTLNNGRININNNAALGTGGFTINGGSIDATTAGITIGNTQNWNGDFTFAGTNDLNLGTGAVAMNATRTVTVTANNLTVGGVISGAGFGLTKAGAGTLTLSGANTYNGTTTVSAGTLTLGHATDTLANSAAVAVAGGILNLGSNNDTVGAVTITSGTIAGSGTLTGSSYALQGGTVNANLGTGTITATSVSTTLNGAAASTTVNINSGALALGSAGSLASTATISVASGATFDLTAKSSGYSLGNGSTLNGLGTVTTASGQALSIGTGAVIAPGTASTSGTLTVGGLTFASGGTYAFTIGNVAGTAGTNWDLLSVTNNFDISATSGSNFTITIGGNSGTPTGFLNSGNYSWNILTLGSGSISGFSPDKFTLTNNISGITGSFTLNATSNALTLNYAAGASGILWSDTGSGAWLTGANWTGGNVPGALDIAQFGVNPTSASANVGINMNSGSTNNGANNQIVGAIELTSARTTNLVIGNSAASTPGTLTLNGSQSGGVSNVVLKNSGSGNLTIQNTASTGGSTMAVALANTENVVLINGSGGITINSTISGSGKNLTLQGTGTGSLTLAGSNTYTGTTTINSGTLRMGANDVFDGSSSISIAGGTLQTSTFTDTVSAFTITSGTLAGTGTLTAATYGLQGGALNANLGTGTITVSSGTTTLSGTAAATTININSGNLTLGGVDRLANTASISMNGGTLNLNNYNESVGSIAGSGSIVLGSATLTTNSSSDTTFSGSISGSGGLTKNGTGTLALSGSNTYNGTTTINAGTVRAAAANALVNTGNITLNPGGSLLVTANGALGTNTDIALNGGTLAFGAGYNGTVGALTLSANSTIDFGTNNNGVLIKFNSINWSNPSALLSIYNWSGTTQWQGGTGNNLDQLYFTNTNLSAGQLSKISFYSGIDQSSFVGDATQIQGGTFAQQIIAVPEPETYLTGILLLLGFTFYQIHLARHGQGLLHRFTFLRRRKC